MSETTGWPPALGMSVAAAGSQMRPEWRRAVEEYADAMGLDVPGTLTAAKVNMAVTWWNNRAGALKSAGEVADFAWPKVPIPLRKLFIQVLDIVCDEMRAPGHRATIAENVIRNEIRRAFENYGDPQ